MKKIIGSVLIILCLSQPAHMLKNANPYGELLHIRQFYVKIIDDELKKKNSTNLEDKDQQVQSLINSLHNNTRRITRLLEDKTNIITTVQNMMSEKARNKQRMTEEQMQTFNKFIRQVESETPKIQTALAQINELRDMKEVQQQILMEEMNYDKIQDKLNQIIDQQSAAIASLDQVLQTGNHTVNMLI